MNTAYSPKLLHADCLITGFPGFLSQHLLRELLPLQPKSSFFFLVQPHLHEHAQHELDLIAEELDFPPSQLHILDADITQPDLALGEQAYKMLLERIGVVWHFAAIYDLSVPERLAYQVNVTGTLHILDFCELAQNLKRLNYISTCYVSGDREGTIFEDELNEDQGFKNHYEETKFWAEVEAQRRLQRGLPITIFRPSIVVGHSQTGATEKFDGPYVVFQLIDRTPSWLPLINLGRGEAQVNLIPWDFCVQALRHIALQENSTGLTFQITDPSPMRSRDIAAMTIDLLGRKRAPLELPPWLAQNALKLNPLQEALELPAETLAYFNHDARYDSRNTQRALANSSIRCPHLASYLPNLLRFMHANR